MTPTPSAAPIRTRTPGERSGLDPLSWAGAPRQVREAAEPAKTVDPSNVSATHIPSAADGDATAITPAAIVGPRIQATSIATASRVNAACRKPGSGTSPAHRLRIADPSGGVLRPATVPAAAIATTEAS